MIAAQGNLGGEGERDNLGGEGGLMGLAVKEVGSPEEG